MKYDVFISYKRVDNVVANAIAHILNSNDISCWHDRQLDFQDAGSNYANRIVEIIKEVKIVVVLLSDEALNSKWVNMEVNTAIDYNKHIIPFVIRELNVDNGLSRLLKQIHWIDAFPNPEKKFNLLLNNIKIEMNRIIDAGKDTDDVRSFNIEVNHDYENDFDFEEGEVLYQAGETVDAIRAYLTSAENDNPKAKKRLCEIFYELDNEIRLIPNNLWEVIDRLAKVGHCYANFLMHAKYYSLSDASLISFEYLKKAIKDNTVPEAFLRLGIHYGWGIGVKQSHTLEMHYYNKAAAMGLATAYSYIGQVYRHGNNKFKQDMEAAISNYEKGIANKNKRALTNLFKLYNYDYQDFEKARELAQRAIDWGYNEGYALMGDTYLTDDSDEAQKWYKIAASKDIKAAYSSLANMYWNEGENERAFQWAHRGVKNGDGGSLHSLGWFYENDRESQYAESWKYYLKYYERFGSGAEHLARLYLVHRYRPEVEEYSLKDLMTALEICAKNSSEECIDNLIEIISNLKEYKEIEPDENKRNDSIIEYERIGAELGFTKYIHLYGMRFFDKNDENNYNPYRGIQWIEKSATNRYKKSVDKLLEVYGKGGIEPDAILCDKWCDFALVNDLADDNSHVILNFIRNCTDYKAVYTDYLLKAIQFESDHSLKHKLYKTLISNHHIDGRQLEQETYDRLLNEVRKHIEGNNIGYAEDLLQYVYPDFDPKALENGSLEINNETLKQYYLTRACGHEFMLEKQREFLMKLYKDVLADKSYEETYTNCFNIFNSRYWYQFVNDSNSIIIHYKKVCKIANIEPIKITQFEPKMFYPAINNDLALAIRFWSIESFLSLIRSGHKIFEGLSITNSDLQILDRAEKETDPDVQMYLIEFVETMIETEEILRDNHKLYISYSKGNYDVLVAVLNKYRDELEKAGIAHNLSEATEEYVRLLFSTSEEEADKSLKTEEDDLLSDNDFDRLLDDFIANQFIEQE